MGQYRALTAVDNQQLLATVHVLSCINLFAVAGDGTCFGAHIFLGNLLRGLSRDRRVAAAARSQALDPLPEVTAVLRATFAHIAPGDVTVILAGGHGAMDEDFALGRIFGRGSPRARFSWQVRSVAEAALPGAAVDASLLCRFPGSASLSSLGDEAALCKGGQRYHVLALDRWGRRVVSQTRFEKDSGCVPREVMREEEMLLGAYTGMLGGGEPPVQRSGLV